MQESYTVEERCADLIRRAEAYFLKLARKHDYVPEGVKRWLDDLERTRALEIVEAIQGAQKEDEDLDVPL